MTTIDVRDIPPANRHPRIHRAFEALDPGDALTIINDHEPRPLYYEMAAEVPDFDADGYEVRAAGDGTFVAVFPKRGPD